MDFCPEKNAPEHRLRLENKIKESFSSKRLRQVSNDLERVHAMYPALRPAFHDSLSNQTFHQAVVISPGMDASLLRDKKTSRPSSEQVS